MNEVLSAGGGDCGNLSSIYVSLLRYKNIPSRHIVTVRPNGSYHVWADFYLANYGWIPVDVTYKQSNPAGNYFGVYDGNGIVVTKEVWLYLEKVPGQYYHAPLLQNYHWWYWNGSGGCSQIYTQHTVSSNEITDIQIIKTNELKIYPNPTSGIINLEPVESKIKKSTICDIAGKPIMERTGTHQMEQIDLSNFESGIYVISIQTDNRVFTKKM